MTRPEYRQNKETIQVESRAENWIMDWIMANVNEDELLVGSGGALLFKLKVGGVVSLFKPKQRHSSTLRGGLQDWLEEGDEPWGKRTRKWIWIKLMLSGVLQWRDGRRRRRDEVRPTPETHIWRDSGILEDLQKQVNQEQGRDGKTTCARCDIKETF